MFDMFFKTYEQFWVNYFNWLNQIMNNFKTLDERYHVMYLTGFLKGYEQAISDQKQLKPKVDPASFIM